MTVNARETRLALLGGAPTFDAPIPVGQLYFPSWDRYEQAIRGIFDRGWYTSHGPLLIELEQRLPEFYGVKHALPVSNATIGLVITLRSLGITGKVIVPSFTFIASAQAITWAGLQAVPCDVDPVTHQITPDTVEAVMDDEVSAILAVNLWGGTCRPPVLEQFARERGLKLIFDSAHASGVEFDGRPLGGFGDAEVFSFHATKILNATEGGCITTDDDALAAMVRNMRSSYGTGPSVPVPLMGNGRFSEAQAAIAMMSLDDFSVNLAHNERIREVYADGLAGIDGVTLLEPSHTSRSNYQCAVVDLDEVDYGVSRDACIAALAADNVIARRYFYPGVHRTQPYSSECTGSFPVTEALCERLMQLPVGALVTEDHAHEIVGLIARISQSREDISRAFRAAR